MSNANSSLAEVAQAIVKLAEAGADEEALERFYADDIVSVESSDEGMPARLEGIEALRAKYEWWNSNAEVHSVSAEGPFIGYADDEFAARYTMDVTLFGERSKMVEIAIYTVRDGRIVAERFLPAV